MTATPEGLQKTSRKLFAGSIIAGALGPGLTSFGISGGGALSGADIAYYTATAAVHHRSLAPLWPLSGGNDVFHTFPFSGNMIIDHQGMPYSAGQFLDFALGYATLGLLIGAGVTKLASKALQRRGNS